MCIRDRIGGMLSGWLSDRCDNRFLLFWYYGLRGLSLMYLPFALDMSFYGLAVFAVFYGLDWIAGVLRIGFGTYFEAFAISGLMCIGAALMVLFIGAGRARRRPL